MAEVKNFQNEENIREIVRDEISQIIPEFEVISNSKLNKEEVKLCEKAEIEYNNRQTKSFDEVYSELL